MLPSEIRTSGYPDKGDVSVNRSFAISLVLIGAISFFAATLASAQGNYTPPRTPWGDPDIQGTFTSDDSINVGMQRRPEFGDRLFLNEEEYNDRVQQGTARAENLLGEEFAPEDANIGTGPPAHWLELGDEFSRQTSLVIDPPNGRIPEMTPEG